jgi:hypothetical protein
VLSVGPTACCTVWCAQCWANCVLCSLVCSVLGQRRAVQSGVLSVGPIACCAVCCAQCWANCVLYSLVCSVLGQLRAVQSGVLSVGPTACCAVCCSVLGHDWRWADEQYVLLVKWFELLHCWADHSPVISSDNCLVLSYDRNPSGIPFHENSVWWRRNE